MIEALLPEWLEADTFQGSAWLGAVPFWLDRIKIRGVPTIPGLRSFPDLNLRTYVRDRFTGTPGSTASRWIPATCLRWPWRTRSITCPTAWRRCTWNSDRSGNLRSTAAGGSRQK